MEKKPLTVAETIAAMLRAYPTNAFKTRADALMRLFRSIDSEWVEGRLVPPNGLVTPDNSYTINEDDFVKHFCVGTEVSAEEEACARLFARRHNLEASFVFDNADLLSLNTSSDLSDVPSDQFMQTIQNMPEDVIPEWREAAKELARCVLRYEYVRSPKRCHDSSWEQRQMRRVEDAKTAAQQVLDSLDPQRRIEQRQRRLANLRQEAEELGVAIIE
jgi:hypothetical protein